MNLHNTNRVWLVLFTALSVPLFSSLTSAFVPISPVSFSFSSTVDRKHDYCEYISAPEMRLQAVRADYPSNNPLVTLTNTYKKLTSEHYLTMAFIQAGILASCADYATQTMACADPISFGHVASMATVASTMSGVMNAIWLRKLEHAFPGTEVKEVVAKTLIHAIIIATIINSAYLVAVPLFNIYLYPDAVGASAHMPPIDPSVIFAAWDVDEFITLTKLEILMFIPYNTLAFKFVSPQIRPLTHAAISATFNVAVSAVTLGYFNTWCEQASHLLG